MKSHYDFGLRIGKFYSEIIFFLDKKIRWLCKFFSIVSAVAILGRGVTAPPDGELRLYM